jgi:hypothetical protein
MIAAGIGVDFPMILHESAVFSRGYKLISLRVVPYHVTAKASTRQTPWCVPWFVPPPGIAGGDDVVKSH